MEKVIITADTVLKIIQSVFNDNDIDQIQSGDLPEDWQGKSIQEILNIKYYTFKHRPESTEMIVSEMKRDGVPVDELAALNRSFGCLILNSVDRIFAKIRMSRLATLRLIFGSRQAKSSCLNI